MSLGKTKEFYNLLRAQFIKEISEDHEISKILSSDTIEKLEKLWQQRLEQSGVYHPHPNEPMRGSMNSNIQPNYLGYGYGTRQNISPNPMNIRMPENIDIRYKPNPLLKNPIPPKQEFHEKIEEPIEVKQEDKTDTEPATIKVDPIKKTETLIKVEPIKPKKTTNDDDEDDGSDHHEEEKHQETDDADLFIDKQPSSTQLIEDKTEEAEKRKAPPIEEVYSPLGSDDSVDDQDITDTTDMIVGYHEKVHRHGSKWKVNLKHCIMNLKGKEYILSSVTGEFDF